MDNLKKQINNFLSSIKNIDEINILNSMTKQHIENKHGSFLTGIKSNNLNLIKETALFKLEWENKHFSKNFEKTFQENIHTLDDECVNFLLNFKPEPNIENSKQNKIYADHLKQVINNSIFIDDNLNRDLKFCHKHNIGNSFIKLISRLVKMNYKNTDLIDLHKFISNQTNLLQSILIHTKTTDNFDFLISSDIYHDNIKKLLKNGGTKTLTERALSNVNLPLIKFLESLGIRVDFSEEHKGLFSHIFSTERHSEVALHIIENTKDISFSKDMALRTIITNDLTDLMIPALKKYTTAEPLVNLMNNKYLDNPKYQGKKCLDILKTYINFLTLNETIPINNENKIKSKKL